MIRPTHHFETKPSVERRCRLHVVQQRERVAAPIVFRDRRYGESKMSGRIIAESMVLVTRWGVRDVFARMPFVR